MGTSLIILVSAVLPIALTVFILKQVLGGLQREKRETERLLATGQPAQGRVLHLGSGGETVTVMGHRHVRVSLDLEVQLAGRPPYQAHVQPLVSELMLPRLQPGAVVQLRVDPTSPRRIAVASAAPAPMGGAPWPGAAPAFAPPDVGGAMKKALPFMIGVFVVTTIPIAAILLYTSAGVGSIFGTRGGRMSPEPASAESPVETAPVHVVPGEPPSERVEPRKVDYFADATSVPSKLASKIGGPVRILELVVYPEYVIVQIQDPRKHQNVDRYTLRGGVVGDGEPVRLMGHGKTAAEVDSSVQDIASVDFRLLPRMVAETKARLAMEEGNVTHAILDASRAFHKEVSWRVYMHSPRDSGSVEFDTAGRVRKVFH